jgi:hypothetical protein
LDSDDFRIADKDWEEEIRLARIGYNGEVQRERCHKLSVAQMLPGLPPEELCASIPIMDVVSGRVKDFLEHPEKAFVPDDSIEVAERNLRALVHVCDGEERAVFDVLLQRRLLEWVPEEEVFTYRSTKVLNGLFGVVKKGATLPPPDGRPLLRTIMNLTPTNRLQYKYDGDMSRLPMCQSWKAICLDESETLRLSSEDLRGAFYLFSLPAGWSRFLVFDHFRLGEEIGLAPRRRYYAGCRTLPMGWPWLSSRMPIATCSGRPSSPLAASSRRTARSGET